MLTISYQTPKRGVIEWSWEKLFFRNHYTGSETLYYHTCFPYFSWWKCGRNVSPAVHAESWDAAVQSTSSWDAAASLWEPAKKVSQLLLP